MSRTFRRKNCTYEEYDWVLLSWAGYSLHVSRIRLDKKSKEGKKRLARYHSDAGGYYKEPGPAWYRRIVAQVPLRRSSKNELRKFMLNEELEVIIETKPPLPYWT